jgi:hypothetical protein
MLDGGSLSATGGTDTSEDGYIDGLANSSFHHLTFNPASIATPSVQSLHPLSRHHVEQPLGTSAGRIYQPRACDTPLSRHQATIPALSLDVHPTTDATHSFPPAKQHPRSRFAHSIVLTSGIDSSSPLPLSSTEIAASHPLAGSTTPRSYYRPSTPEPIFHSFNG